MKLPMAKVRSEEEITKEVVDTTLRRSLRFYSTLQAEDGFWPGDYGGPMFLLPGLVGSSSTSTHLCINVFFPLFSQSINSNINRISNIN
jgi:hypothetical protein